MGRQLRPFEVKLTVVPDATTASDHPSQWSSEMVLRQATTSFCAMSVYSHMPEDISLRVRELAQERRLFAIKDWDNSVEIQYRIDDIAHVVKHVFTWAAPYQVPLILQPIWATNGLSPILNDDAFDMFVWTDTTIMAVMYNELFRSSGRRMRKQDEIMRKGRSVVRFCRAMIDLCSKGTFNYSQIYSDIGCDTPIP